MMCQMSACFTLTCHLSGVGRLHGRLCLLDGTVADFRRGTFVLDRVGVFVMDVCSRSLGELLRG
jgi:hypothetical protein